MVNNVNITAIAAIVLSCCLVSSVIIISLGMKPEKGGSPLRDNIRRAEVEAIVGFFVQRVASVPILVALIRFSIMKAGVVMTTYIINVITARGWENDTIIDNQPM